MTELRFVGSEAELFVRDKWVGLEPVPDVVLSNPPSTC